MRYFCESGSTPAAAAADAVQSFSSSQSSSGKPEMLQKRTEVSQSEPEVDRATGDNRRRWSRRGDVLSKNGAKKTSSAIRKTTKRQRKTRTRLTVAMTTKCNESGRDVTVDDGS